MTNDAWNKVLGIVKDRLPRDFELSEAQLLGLQAAWERKGYKEVAKKGRSEGYLTNVMVPVYSKLSESFRRDVKKHNFRDIIEELILGNILFEEIPNSPPVLGKPPRVDLLIGREEDIEIIDKAYSQQNIIVIHGSKGIGKTSFVSAFFQKISKTNIFQKYIWYAPQQISFEDNIIEINKLLDSKKITSQLNDFLNYISANKILIVIDGVDSWLSNNLGELNGLIKRINELNHNSLIMTTSRTGIQVSKLLQRQGHPILNVKLEGLSFEASKQLFGIHGVEGKGIDELIDSNRGIPSLMLDTIEKVKLLDSDIEQYLEDKTLFATNSEKENLDEIFSDETGKIKVRDRYVLYILNNSTEKLVNINEFINQVRTNSEYTRPEILESIEILEENSLISINKSSNSVKLLKHDEVRGYVTIDPLRLFQFEKMS